MHQARHKSDFFFLALPFPLLSRERNRNGKGTGFCFGTEDLPAQQSGGRQMLFVWVSFDPSWVICVMPVERRFELERTGWQQAAQNQKNGDLNLKWKFNFVTCFLHTKPGVSTMLVAMVPKNYNSFIACSSRAPVQRLSFLWVKQPSPAKIRLLRFINVAKCRTLSVTKIFLLPVARELQWLCSCRHAEPHW